MSPHPRPISPPFLLALVVLGSLAVLFLRQRRASRAGAPGTVLPLTGRETGPFDAYLARIEALARSGADDFFVTAVEAGGPRFVQVSAARDPRGVLGYQFDIPVTDWSAPYLQRIGAEARKRGLTPLETDGGPMSFLDIEFPTSGDHAVFARWVVTEVFGLPKHSRYEITWG